jgi:hypothetical protein
VALAWPGAYAAARVLMQACCVVTWRGVLAIEKPGAGTVAAKEVVTMPMAHPVVGSYICITLYHVFKICVCVTVCKSYWYK